MEPIINKNLGKLSSVKGQITRIANKLRNDILSEGATGRHKLSLVEACMASEFNTSFVACWDALSRRCWNPKQRYLDRAAVEAAHVRVAGLVARFRGKTLRRVTPGFDLDGERTRWIVNEVR